MEEKTEYQVAGPTETMITCARCGRYIWPGISHKCSDPDPIAYPTDARRIALALERIAVALERLAERGGR